MRLELSIGLVRCLGLKGHESIAQALPTGKPVLLPPALKRRQRCVAGFLPSLQGGSVINLNPG